MKRSLQVLMAMNRAMCDFVLSGHIDHNDDSPEKSNVASSVGWDLTTVYKTRQHPLAFQTLVGSEYLSIEDKEI